MTKAEAMTAISKMKVRGLSVMITPRFVVVRTNRTTWRLGEVSGDWLMHGTAEQVIDRAFRDASN